MLAFPPPSGLPAPCVEPDGFFVPGPVAWSHTDGTAGLLRAGSQVGAAAHNRQRARCKPSARHHRHWAVVMLAELIDRDAMIDDCAEWYGVDPRLFRHLDQDVLDHAWIEAREHWG